MTNNRVIQFFLIVTALILFFITYHSNKKDEDKIADIKENNLITDGKLTNEISNIISNANYSGTNGRGTFFNIKADTAFTSSNDPTKSQLKKVFATIRLGNLKIIEIRSDEGIFNKTSNDAEFFGNILITESDNIITCENLDIFMSKNLITAYNNVKYKNSQDSYLLADKIDIDMITKEANIFMFNNKNDKVKIKYIN